MKKHTKKNMKKTLTKITLTAGLSITALAIIETGMSSGIGSIIGTSGSSNVVAAIDHLGDRLQALSEAGVKAVNNTAYQIDQNLPTLIQVNQQNVALNAPLQVSSDSSSTPSNSVASVADSITMSQIRSTLQQIPNLALTTNDTSNSDQQAANNAVQQQNNLINTLTLGTPASDTIYSEIFGSNNTWDTNGYNMGKPTTLHNSYFNFGTLFTPQAYSLAQQNASKKYIQYLSRSYTPITAGINFSQLTDAIQKAANSPASSSSSSSTPPPTPQSVLYSFLTSPAYQNYQIGIRSTMAAQSLALSNFNQLTAERTPSITTQPDPNQAAISQEIGVTPQTLCVQNGANIPFVMGSFCTGKKEYVYASPLQIQNWVATHRVNNPQWYQQMATASPATVQRETLHVLAEIESQMYQAHMDNERMIATLTALQMNSSQQSQMMTQTNVNDVNTEISNLDNSSATTNNNSAPANYQPNQQQQQGQQQQQQNQNQNSN